MIRTEKGRELHMRLINGDLKVHMPWHFLKCGGDGEKTHDSYYHHPETF